LSPFISFFFPFSISEFHRTPKTGGDQARDPAPPTTAPVAAKTGQGDKKSEKDPLPSEFYSRGVTLRLEWLKTIWSSRPRDKMCDTLMKDLEDFFGVVPRVYKVDSYFVYQKTGPSSGKLVSSTGSSQYIVENSLAFLESLGSITTIGAWVDLSPALISRMNRSEKEDDIWELLNVFTALSQAVSDHKMKGLIWAILVVGVLRLHYYIRAIGVPIVEWPAKLRNCVAHSQVRIIGPVLVGYNFNPKSEKGGDGGDDHSNSGSCNWQIQVERDDLKRELRLLFERVVKVSDVSRYDSKNWQDNILKK
jgi:hypothetical protein